MVTCVHHVSNVNLFDSGNKQNECKHSVHALSDLCVEAVIYFTLRKVWLPIVSYTGARGEAGGHINSYYSVLYLHCIMDHHLVNNTPYQPTPHG